MTTKKKVDDADVGKAEPSLFDKPKGVTMTSLIQLANNAGFVKMEVTQERPDLDVLLAEWQPVMGLADWKATVRYERHMTDRGRIYYHQRNREAEILIQDPLDYLPTDRWPHDPEHTVVHELAHLHFVAFDFKQGSRKDIAEDQAVNAFARALIQVKRAKLGSAP